MDSHLGAREVRNLVAGLAGERFISHWSFEGLMNIALEKTVNRQSKFASSSGQRIGVQTRKHRSGNSVIEMVFALQVLLFLSFGMVEFGQFFYIRHAFVSAARDGCRVAILPSTVGEATVDTAISNTLTIAGITGYSSGNWLTMQESQYGTSWASVPSNDPSQVPTGWAILIKLQTTYSQIPLAVRPLSGITGNKFGIGAAKLVTGQATMVMQ